jgi:hypothetical protein
MAFTRNTSRPEWRTVPLGASQGFDFGITQNGQAFLTIVQDDISATLVCDTHEAIELAADIVRLSVEIEQGIITPPLIAPEPKEKQ